MEMLTKKALPLFLIKSATVESVTYLNPCFFSYFFQQIAAYRQPFKISRTSLDTTSLFSSKKILNFLLDCKQTSFIEKKRRKECVLFTFQRDLIVGNLLLSNTLLTTTK